jgi:hypothetical protein
VKFVGRLLRKALVQSPTAPSSAVRSEPDVVVSASRLLVAFGLSGWALTLSLLFAALLALKVADWPAVGWFVDAGGRFAGFGFIRVEEGWSEVLGGWSLPIFGSLAAGLLWMGVLGVRKGLKTARAVLGM